VVHVSNADGVALPVAKVAKAARAAGARVFVDAAQSAAHGPIGLDALGADFVAVSLHKMLGPSGVGALVGRPEAWDELGPFQLGGGTVVSSGPEGFELAPRPDRFEAGLSNFAGLVAVEAGLAYLTGLGWDGVAANDRRLNARATQGLQAIQGVRVIGPVASERTSIVPFVVDGLDPHDVAGYLDEAADVAVRSGAHCVHSYFARRGLTGTVRASLHAYNTPEDVDRMVAAVAQLAASVRGRSAKAI
jgi:cysteine desulfurase/selenocysteine lyase